LVPIILVMSTNGIQKIIPSATEQESSLTPWLTHTGGATQLLIRRGVMNLRRDVGVGMFLLQNVNMIIRGLIEGQSIPKELNEWVKTCEILETPITPEQNSIHLMRAISLCTSIMERAKTLLASSGDTGVREVFPTGYCCAGYSDGAIADDWIAAVWHLVDDIIALDRRLHYYAEALCPPGSDTPYKRYEKMFIVSNWSMYLAARIVLNRVLEESVYHLQDTPEADVLIGIDMSECLNQYLQNAIFLQQRLASTLLDLVPPSIGLESGCPNRPKPAAEKPGTLQSYFAMWPIYFALHGTKHLTTEQRNWASSVFEYIAYNDGLHLAKLLATAPYDLMDKISRARPRKDLSVRVNTSIELWPDID
jgi:hypothetical protein